MYRFENRSSTLTTGIAAIVCVLTLFAALFLTAPAYANEAAGSAGGELAAGDLTAQSATSGKLYGATWKLSAMPGSNEHAKLTIKNNKKVGKATVIVTGKGDYIGTLKATFKITKGKNTLAASANAKVFTLTKAKVNKGKGTLTKKKVFNISKNKGAVTFKKTSGNSKILVSKAGKVAVLKGLAKGTYKVKVKVTAAGNSSYKAGSKTVAFKIRVK